MCSSDLFMHGLALAQIGLNRKQLAELAVRNPEVFAEIVAAAKAAKSAA